MYCSRCLLQTQHEIRSHHSFVSVFWILFHQRTISTRAVGIRLHFQKARHFGFSIKAEFWQLAFWIHCTYECTGVSTNYLGVSEQSSPLFYVPCVPAVLIILRILQELLVLSSFGVCLLAALIFSCGCLPPWCCLSHPRRSSGKTMCRGLPPPPEPLLPPDLLSDLLRSLRRSELPHRWSRLLRLPLLQRLLRPRRLPELCNIQSLLVDWNGIQSEWSCCSQRQFIQTKQW